MKLSNFKYLSIVRQDATQKEIAEVTRNCAISNNISPEQIGVLRQTADKSTISPSEDLKCFAKCAIEKSDFIKDGALNLERVVAVSVAHGKDGEKVRESALVCADKITATNTCSEAWELYVCFNKQ